MSKSVLCGHFRSKEELRLATIAKADAFFAAQAGQVADVIEVMLGAATRVGEALELRQCDVDLDAEPPRVSITGTIVVRNRAGVFRQKHPTTHESNRIIGEANWPPSPGRRDLSSTVTSAFSHRRWCRPTFNLAA